MVRYSTFKHITTTFASVFRFRVTETGRHFAATKHVPMGVDHGGVQGDKSSQNLKRGDANANCPPRFCHIGTRSVTLKIRQNPFSAGALPRTALGELTTLPRPLSRLERGHPSPYPTSLGTNPPSALRSPCVPQKSSQIYAYARSLGFKYTKSVFEAEPRPQTHFWCI